MPDIKTALQQALAKTATEWAADDEAHHKIEPKQEKTMTVTVSATTPTPAAPAAPAPTPAKPATTNLSRTTFELIRDNPGLTMGVAMTVLEKKGFKPSSVSSLIYQMIKVRLIVADPNGKLTAVVSEYVPIQTSMIRKRKAKAKDKAKAKPVLAAGLASIAPVAAPLPRKHIEIVNTRTGEVFNPRKEEWTVESVIGSLNVRQAMAVYDELRKIFGE